MPALIDVSDFKEYFDRDFIFGTAMTTVRDSDIQRAIDQGLLLFNLDLWDSITNAATAFYLVTAHCLVKIIAAGGGIDREGAGIKSIGNGPISSKGAGGLSISYALPAELTDNPILNDFMTTGYGKMYLQVLVPNLIGNIFSIGGATQP